MAILHRRSPERSEYIEISGILIQMLMGLRINVSFIDKDGQRSDFQVSEGDNLLDIAQANDLEMEGKGA
jgi:hypothetical protein